MAEERTARRTQISEGWLPGEDGREYAANRGIVDIDETAEAFRDHHLGRGTLMASWAAAWRTWCRNQVRFGQASGQRNLPLLTVLQTPDPADPYGVKAWASRLTDARPDTLAGGIVAMCLGGYDAAGTARDLCEAAGLPADWRGDLDPIAEWLRCGVDPDHMLRVVRSTRGPQKAGSWRYYSARMLEGSARLAL